MPIDKIDTQIGKPVTRETVKARINLLSCEISPKSCSVFLNQPTRQAWIKRECIRELMIPLTMFS